MHREMSKEEEKDLEECITDMVEEVLRKGDPDFQDTDDTYVPIGHYIYLTKDGSLYEFPNDSQFIKQALVKPLDILSEFTLRSGLDAKQTNKIIKDHSLKRYEEEIMCRIFPKKC